jgi:hypothetical protein
MTTATARQGSSTSAFRLSLTTAPGIAADDSATSRGCTVRTLTTTAPREHIGPRRRWNPPADNLGPRSGKGAAPPTTHKGETP